MTYFAKTTFTLLLFLCFIFLFQGCATTAKYEEILNSWLGGDVNQMIDSWGIPSDEYQKPNGETMYTWLWVGNTLVTSNYNKFLKMTLTQSTTFWCKTTFTTNKKGKIIDWRWEGNACRAN